MSQLILASASARRRELLQQVGLNPVCLPVDVDETARSGESAMQLVRRLAQLKAGTCLQRLKQAEAGDAMAAVAGTVILAADTVLELDNRVLGKPIDRDDFMSTLLALGGRQHAVISGVCVIALADSSPQHCVVTTQVRFGPVSREQATAYWASGEPADKAGGYAIQGLGARFVEHLSGSYSNVVGLPLYETLAMLERAGVSPV